MAPSSAIAAYARVTRRRNVVLAWASRRYAGGMASTFADETDLSPERVRELLEAGEIQLVDVREPYEWEAGRIPGARHIEMERLASQAETIDPDRPVVFQCRIGSRSGMAAQAFRAAGFDAYNLRGGLLAWSDRELPMEPEGSAYVADH
jgi:rhodanese-related sulfurtransferase